MASHNGMRFSTVDCDHDTGSGNCAASYKGAWWYSNCLNSNLNGMYHVDHHNLYDDGIEWFTWHGYTYSLKSSKMMIAKH